MRYFDSPKVSDSIFKVQVIKPLIPKRSVVLLGKLCFHEPPLCLKFRIIGINLALGLHDDCLVYLPFPTLNNQEVRCIQPDILPGSFDGLIAFDLELCQSPVSVVVDFEPQFLQQREGQYVMKEGLFKAAVRMVGQVMIGSDRKSVV